MKLLEKMKWGVLACAVLNIAPVQAQVMETSVRDRMYMAASTGNMAELRRLVSLGYSLELTDENGNTPYCQAVWAQNRTAVALLAQAGANERPACLKKIPYVTEASIYAAARSGNLDKLVAWKKEGLNIDVVNPQTGNSALCEAVYRYDCDAIQVLLKAGSNQAQPCMRRVPSEVREKLQCRPLKIDWGTIGYTVLGVGMAGGLVAIFGGNGSNGVPICKDTERWNGSKCLSCDTCWIGTTCISAEEKKAKPYYADEKTRECWTVSPPPVTLDDKELEAAKEKISAEDTYKKGGFLPMINAAAAYARGYNGYMVERISPYGRLVNEAVESGRDPKLSDQKVTVAIYSSGMAIGSGGTVTTTEVSEEGKSETKTTDVWNWDRVNRAFYDWNSDEITINGSYKPSGSSSYSEPITGTISPLESVANNLAISDTTKKPYGYNFDYGPCSGARQNWKNCYGPDAINEADTETNWTAKDEKDSSGNITSYAKAAFYGSSGSITAYVLYDKGKTGSVSGTIAAKTDVCKNAACAPWTGGVENFFTPYSYANPEDNGTYVYDASDPSPHYKGASGQDVNWGNVGTFLAGIVGAMKGGGDMYGVAYHVSILPVNRDVLLGMSSDAMTKMTSNAEIILMDEAAKTTTTSGDYRNDVLGAFTLDSEKGIYTARSVASIWGADASSAYSLLGNKNRVLVIGTGNYQARDATNYLTQPVLQTAIPLLSEFNGDTTWSNSGSSSLPRVNKSNPLKNLFVAVTSVLSTSKSSDGSTILGRLPTYAQPCGISASYCVSAPGGASAAEGSGLYSTVDPWASGGLEQKYNYDREYGTSQAGAVVSGALAVIMGAYPHLTAQQAVEILFKTATYLEPSSADKDAYSAAGGVYQAGSDDYGDYNSIFGRGLINLEAATQPVDGVEGLWVYTSGTAVGKDKGVIVSGPDATTTSVTAASTKMITSASIAPDLTASLPQSFVGFDAYNRAFPLPTSQLFKQQTRRKAKSWQDFKLFMKGRDPMSISTTDNFSMLFREQVATSSTHSIPAGLMQVTLKQDKMKYSLFYTEDTSAGRDAYWKRKLSNPFIQMHDAYGLETSYQLSSKWSVEAGWTAGRNGFFDTDDRDFNAPDNKMQAFTSSVVYQPVDKMAFKVATGVMRETGSSLGMVSSGAFDIDGANTYFVGAGVVFTPMDKIRLEAMYYYGKTRTEQGEGLMNLSRLTSDSFAMTASYEPKEGALLGMQISSPLRVRRGHLDVTLPVGRDATEELYYYDTYRVDMKPKARELDLSMYYQGQVNEAVSVQSEVGVRLHPDHQANASPDYRGMLGVKWSY